MWTHFSDHVTYRLTEIRRLESKWTRRRELVAARKKRTDAPMLATSPDAST